MFLRLGSLTVGGLMFGILSWRGWGVGGLRIGGSMFKVFSDWGFGIEVVEFGLLRFGV